MDEFIAFAVVVVVVVLASRMTKTRWLDERHSCVNGEVIVAYGRVLLCCFTCFISSLGFLSP